MKVGVLRRFALVLHLRLQPHSPLYRTPVVLGMMVDEFQSSFGGGLLCITSPHSLALATYVLIWGVLYGTHIVYGTHAEEFTNRGKLD